MAPFTIQFFFRKSPQKRETEINSNQLNHKAFSVSLTRAREVAWHTAQRAVSTCSEYNERTLPNVVPMKLGGFNISEKKTSFLLQFVLNYLQMVLDSRNFVSN